MKVKIIKRYFKHLFVPHRGNAYRPHALRHKALSYYAFMLLVAQVAFGVTLYSGPVLAADGAEALSKNIVVLTNAERTKNNLTVLKENNLLRMAARQKLDDMFKKNYWDHKGPGGETAWDFIENENYAYQLAGENLARGYSNSGEVVTAWMNSPTHRQNILNDRFREIGVAVGSGRIMGNLTTIIVQLFGQPQATLAATETSETTVLGEQSLLPEFSLENTTIPSKSPYLFVWLFIFGLVVVDGVMVRRLGLHTSRVHIYHFRVSLLMVVLAFSMLGVGIVGIA